MPTQHIALMAALITSLVWGLTGVFVRLLPLLSPLTITAGRLLIALAAVLPVYVMMRHLTQGKVQASTLSNPTSYVLALLLAGYYLLATTAFQLAPVAEVALLLSTQPLFVLGFRRLHGDTPSNVEISGALLALGGITLILLPKMSFVGELQTPHIVGNLLAVCAAGLTALYAYLYRIAADRGRAPEVMALSLLTFAAGGFVLMLIAVVAPTPTGLDTLDGQSLLVFVGLGVLATAIPTVSFAMASRHLPAVVTAMISLFIPVFAGFFAYLILGEGLSPMFIPGGILVLGGIAMILRQGQIRRKAA